MKTLTRLTAFAGVLDVAIGLYESSGLSCSTLELELENRTIFIIMLVTERNDEAIRSIDDQRSEPKGWSGL